MKTFLSLGYGITLAAMMFLHAAPGRAGEAGDAAATVGTRAAIQETTARTPTATQGMRVYRDPQTGRLGPPPPGVQPPGLSAAELRMLNRSDQGLVQRVLPHGGVAVDLQGRYQNMAVATVDEDGRAAVNCQLTPAQARAALQAGQQGSTGSAD